MEVPSPTSHHWSSSSSSSSPPTNLTMLKNGSFAVAVVQRQVVLVQAVRNHTKRDRYIEATPYAAFGGSRIFLALSEKHIARIPSSDILSTLPSPSSAATSDSESDDDDSAYCIFGSDVSVGEGTIELPERAFEEFVRLSEQHYNRPRSASRSSKLWTSLTGRAASARH